MKTMIIATAATFTLSLGVGAAFGTVIEKMSNYPSDHNQVTTYPPTKS